MVNSNSSLFDHNDLVLLTASYKSWYPGVDNGQMLIDWLDLIKLCYDGVPHDLQMQD